MVRFQKFIDRCWWTTPKTTLALRKKLSSL